METITESPIERKYTAITLVMADMPISRYPSKTQRSDFSTELMTRINERSENKAYGISAITICEYSTVNLLDANTRAIQKGLDVPRIVRPLIHLYIPKDSKE